MAETVTIEGQPFLRRNPFGVLGLTHHVGDLLPLLVLPINDELRRFEHDETISPTRSLMAMLGWILIVPPFIAYYNTAVHIKRAEDRVGMQQQIEPVLVVLFALVFSIVNPPYMQDHMNRIWDHAGNAPSLPPAPLPQ